MFKLMLDIDNAVSKVRKWFRRNGIWLFVIVFFGTAFWISYRR